MITIKVQSVQAAAEKYMENHLSQGEHKSEGEDQRGSGKSNLNQDLAEYYAELPLKWHGNLVSRLGFDPTKPLTKAQFKSLLENKNPNTGKNLTARTIHGRRLYFDATTSAPKSVSILAVTMNDYRLIKAHEEATAFSITEIEKFAQTRVRVDGQHTVRKTGNVLCASATHTTSRTNDPQLHSHNLFFNVTWDQIEQKYKALEAYEIYDKATYFTEIYRHVLAQKVKELGYQIEHKKHGWEIKGVSPEICTKFSKRSSLIKKLTHQFEQSLGRELTNNEKSLITEKSRRAKSKNLTLKQAVELQQSELTLSEKQSLERIKTLSLIEQKMNENSFKSIKKLSTQLNKDFETKADVDAFDFAIRHVFERQSTVSKQDLITAAIKSDYGKLNLNIIDKLIDSNPNLFRGENDLIGTIQGLSYELYISEFIEKSAGKFKENKIQSISVFDQFTDEQKQAFHEIITSPDQVHFLEGSAGTGKSFLLKGVSDAITENKIQLLATAPTASAALSLEKDVGVPAQTLQSLLYNHDLFKDQLTNGYLIVDEAGFISSAQMDKLFKITEKYNTQVLLVGDTKQHHGVEAGDALRSLKLYSNIRTSSLKTVIRQKNINYKSAINDLQNLNYKAAWEKFNQMGVVHSLDQYLKDKGQKISDNDLNLSLDYDKLIQSYKSHKDLGESVLVVTPSRFEVQTLTQKIRNSLDLDFSTSIQKKSIVRSDLQRLKNRA
jgi:conjugative relaxase-like TrwC/TraI family protein